MEQMRKDFEEKSLFEPIKEVSTPEKLFEYNI